MKEEIKKAIEAIKNGEDIKKVIADNKDILKDIDFKKFIEDNKDLLKGVDIDKIADGIESKLGLPSDALDKITDLFK